MSKPISFEDWKNSIPAESEPEELIRSKNLPKTFSRETSATFGYMLGVDVERLRENMEGCGDFDALLTKILKIPEATTIRHLNRIRSTIMLNFAEISQRIRITADDYCPIWQLPLMKDDFKTLKDMEIDFITGRTDLNEYLRVINNEIEKRVEKTKPLFPEWVNFNYISSAFMMPASVEYESKKFAANRNYYPYQKYFHWNKPQNCGNIVLSDNKLLYVLYYNNYDRFTEQNKVTDIDERVKDNIYQFIEQGNNIQMFVDGENTDPYRLHSALQSLSLEELDKIDKIVIYYDDKFSTPAWMWLRHFVDGVNIETIPVVRLKEDKSLVDHKLVAGVSKAVYQDGVDSVMLCSSDSDFWSVIEDVPANYLVMAESRKCSKAFKSALRNNTILYCFLDKFRVSADNPFRKYVLNRSFQSKLNSALSNAHINIKNIYDEALSESYVVLSEQEIKNNYQEILENISFGFDSTGELNVIMQ